MKTTKNTTTVTITVNIATGNKNEGNYGIRLDVDESSLRGLDPAPHYLNLTQLIQAAVEDYYKKNK